MLHTTLPYAKWTCNIGRAESGLTYSSLTVRVFYYLQVFYLQQVFWLPLFLALIYQSIILLDGVCVCVCEIGQLF